MYAPARFRWTDTAAALQFAAEYNFGVLITQAPSAPFVTHLPFLISEDRRVLRGHVARANPHSGRLHGRDHVVLFNGPHAYISPDWYANSEDVPTWNYLAVHVSGAARVLTGEAETTTFLADLAAHEETRRRDLSDGEIWTLDKTPPQKLSAMKKAIVVFEIDVSLVEATAKLNQNKPRESVEGVIAALMRDGGDNQRETAARMRRALQSRRGAS